MDVFHLRDQLVEDYREYHESFIRIKHERILGTVEDRLQNRFLSVQPGCTMMDVLSLNGANLPLRFCFDLGGEKSRVDLFRLRDQRVEDYRECVEDRSGLRTGASA